MTKLSLHISELCCIVHVDLKLTKSISSSQYFVTTYWRAQKTFTNTESVIIRHNLEQGLGKLHVKRLIIL